MRAKKTKDPATMTMDEAKAEYDRILDLPPTQFNHLEMRAEACLDRIRILSWQINQEGECK